MPHKHRPSFEGAFWYVPRKYLADAEKRFEEYLEVILEIYERIQSDPEALERFKKTLKSHRQNCRRKEDDLA
ncbi:MAG: hypothetical protein HY471_01785 [Candidatus Sungbacteria bacterium]|nr:hypothetical protein [Candidatus Sungbacteria bacterium]